MHRQLAAAISYSPLHASLHSKTHVERALDVVNRRHRMAQMASRASVEFYVGLALKARAQRSASLGAGKVTEEAYVIRTFRNGLNVFVSKLVLFLRIEFNLIQFFSHFKGSASKGWSRSSVRRGLTRTIIRSRFHAQVQGLKTSRSLYSTK